VNLKWKGLIVVTLVCALMASLFGSAIVYSAPKGQPTDNAIIFKIGVAYANPLPANFFHNFVVLPEQAGVVYHGHISGFVGFGQRDVGFYVYLSEPGIIAYAQGQSNEGGGPFDLEFVCTKMIITIWNHENNPVDTANYNVYLAIHYQTCTNVVSMP
jgi:hypothetical protein